MKNQMTELERKRLLELAREYRKSGYEVIIEPNEKQLPSFIAPFRPDMIAWNTVESVVFEVKSQKTLSSSPELQDIARAVHGRKGWRFELVVTNSKDKDVVAAETEEILDYTEILSRLQEAQILSQQEFGEAAFIIAWSAAEAVMRKIAARERVAKDNSSFEYLSKNLYAQGILEKDQYETFLEAARIRNSIVHGYKEPRSLAKTFNKVVSITNKLLSEAALA